MKGPIPAEELDRELRKPLFVPVFCRPALEGCWSVDVSESGIGLVARPPSEVDGPIEGESIELELTLPTGAQLRARGVVRWRHESATRLDGASTGFGVAFEALEGDGRLELRRFLTSHRMRVLVAGADRTLARGLELAFHGDLQLQLEDDPAAVEGALDRGDVAAVLLCGDDEFRALSLAHLIESASRAASLHLGRPAALKPRIVFAAHASPERLVELFNAGAVDRALPPEATVSALHEAVLAACREHEVRLQQQRMAVELERLLRDRRRAGPSVPDGIDGPGFDSAGMRAAIASLRQVAPFKVTVLLQGETGTGKEVLAQRLHRLSPRAAEPFVVQDCGSLTETLLESELFGHVKGAFTGAVADHPGLFVLADGGTIFLDEIENTTPNLQARLLRVLETGEVRPVGGRTVRRVDVRVVAASNRTLADEVAAHRFRADLYYRLETFPIEVPPLRERAEDVLPLARHFLDLFNRQLGRSAQGFDADAEARLLAWRWPGNVRELRNVVERAVLLSAPLERLGPAKLPGPLRLGAALAPGARGLRAQLDALERRLVAEALARHGGVVRRAATELEMDAVTLGRRARRLGLVR